MEKAHSRIKWENYPSIATPLNETNLNKMDIALDEVDNRVLGLDTAKLDKAVANTMVKDIAFNEKTGIFTITLLDGTTKTIDTKLEKVATNFSYDYETQKLVLTLVDGTEQEIDMSTLISQYEFADTSTIGFTVGNEGKITAIVKDGSITEAKLQPNFLANVKTEVSKAKSYADSSYENATTSRNAVTEAKQYRDEALQFRNEAESFAPEGYADLVEQVNENTVKVDTIIEKADLGIKETATGEEIHLTDSAEGKAVEFALYGKATQDGEPTPQYPQPIEVPSGDVVVISRGNQLFNKNTVKQGFLIVGDGSVVPSDDWVVCDYILAKQSKPYVLSQSTDAYFQYIFCFYDRKKTIISNLIRAGNNNSRIFNFTTPENTAYMRIAYAITVSGSTVDRGNIMLNEGSEMLPWEEYKESISTIPVTDFAGIKVSSNGNYTDSNGQQWICDEVVKYADGSGEKIQRVNVDTFNYIDNLESDGIAKIKVADKHHDNLSWTTAGRSMCSMISNNYSYNNMVKAVSNSSDKSIYCLMGTGNGYYMYCIYIPSIEQTKEAYNEFLSNTPITFVSVKPEPIITPLTAEEIAEIEKLHTFYPITNISNDFDCGMSVTYYCDSKNYIDNKIALLTTAMVNNI